MFEKYHGIINLDYVLYEKYHYQFTGDEQDFYNQDFIEAEILGKDAKCWITYNNDRYLFKDEIDFEYNVWGELISSKIAKYLGIPCAEYRVATLHGKKGLITKSFLAEDETLILGNQLIQKYLNFHSPSIPPFENKELLRKLNIPEELLNLEKAKQKDYIINYLNNLEQIWNILYSDTTLTEKELQNITNAMTNTLLFDIITLQGDRHAYNWGIIKSNNNFRFSPIFDNSTSLGLGFPFMERRAINFRSELFNRFPRKNTQQINQFIYQVRPSFTLSTNNILEPTTGKKDIGPKVLEDLLRKADIKTQEQIAATIQGLSIDLFDSIIKECETENNLTMNDNVYFYLSNIFEINLNNLKEIINKQERNINYEPRKNIKSI